MPGTPLRSSAQFHVEQGQEQDALRVRGEGGHCRHLEALLKRRQAIEPIIGHLKSGHRMDRCHLKGEQGDRLHAVLCAAGYNIRWLLRMIAKKGVPFLQRLYLRLCQATAIRPNWLRMVRERVCIASARSSPRLLVA